MLDPDEIVVFGVATDVCDDAAIRGFLERGRRVRFVEDAARGLDESRVAACTAAWRERGVEFTTTEEIVHFLVEGISGPPAIRQCGQRWRHCTTGWLACAISSWTDG